MIGSQLQNPRWHLYLLTAPNGKRYVGQSKSTPEHRWAQHKSNSKRKDGGTCRILYAAMRKYGPDEFTHEILLYCDEAMIDYYETIFIAKFETIAPGGLNIESGGNKNKTHSVETRELQRQKALSRDTTSLKRSEETRNLPKYINRVKTAYRDGYRIVKHPNCSSKSFVDPLMSPEENLKDAIVMLERLNSGDIVFQPKYVLPAGVYRIRRGYIVKYLEIDDTAAIKSFVDPSMTANERREAAIAFALQYSNRIL